MEGKTAPAFEDFSLCANERNFMPASRKMCAQCSNAEWLRRSAVEAIGPTAAMAIGLREIQVPSRGESTETECIAAVTLSTRRYAKRQLTWFRNQFTFQIIDLTGLRDTHESPLAPWNLLGVSMMADRTRGFRKKPFSSVWNVRESAVGMSRIR